MEALYVKENFNIRWVSQTGFVENIGNILREYKQSRGLLVSGALPSPRSAPSWPRKHVLSPVPQFLKPSASSRVDPFVQA